MLKEHARIVAELTSDKAKLTAELTDALTKHHNASLLLTTSRTNLKMSNERYEQLEKTHHQELIDHHNLKLVEWKRLYTEGRLEREKLEESLVSVKEEMLRKEAEIRDLKTDMSEHRLVIDNKEKRIEELELKLAAAGEEIG